jgi:hypothetical protein
VSRIDVKVIISSEIKGFGEGIIGRRLRIW